MVYMDMVVKEGRASVRKGKTHPRYILPQVDQQGRQLQHDTSSSGRALDTSFSLNLMSFLTLFSLFRGGLSALAR